MPELLTHDAATAAIAPRLARFLPDTDRIAVSWVPAQDLLVPQRLDLAVKLMYADWTRRQIDCDFARRLYLEHLRVFNGCVEADGSGKITAEQFCASFDALIADVTATGFREDAVIPVSEDGVVLDGAHRVAVCLALGLPVPVVRTTLERGPVYDADYFEARGMKQPFLDAAIFAYAKWAPRTRVVLVWPTAEGRNPELEGVVREHAQVVARKDVVLSANAAVNLVCRTYADEPWLGGPSDDYAGARNKAQWCTRGRGPLRVFLVEPTQDPLQLKESVRGLFGHGKHSVHINDTHDETVELVELLFNDNSLHHLHLAPPTAPRWFRRLFAHYDSWLRELPAEEQDRFCIDGSAVLAAYGVRDVRDLDFLHCGAGTVDTGFREIALHEGAEELYARSVDCLVHDPTVYFSYRGRKMLAAPLIREMKARRGDSKDVDDVEMLDAVLSHSLPAASPRTWLRKNLSPRRLKGRAKLAALKGRYHLLMLKRRMGQGRPVR
jgi:hypothetical protein